MINPKLYTKPAAVDNVLHSSLKAGQLSDDWSVAARLNAIFVTAVEFGDVSSEFPIVFIDAGSADDGKRQVAPIAVFGLGSDENLFVDGKAWRARYQPALLRAYPFGIGRAEGSRVVIVIDESWHGWSQTEGQALFEQDGRPTAFLTSMREYLDKVETEVQRTRLFGQALVDADLLTSMRFDATLPDGKTVTVDGFLTVDEKKLGELPDAKVVEFHRNGVLGLIHAHQMSLRHMRQLVEWRAARAAAAAAPA
jgi:SapC